MGNVTVYCFSSPPMSPHHHSIMNISLSALSTEAVQPGNIKK